MSSAPRQFERFVAALHRRLVVVNLLERSGLGALAGAAVAAAVIPLLMWRGGSALAPVLGALGIGAVVGLVWALGHLPTALDAAGEADRQLGLADLLGTALSVRAHGRESDRDADAAPWLATVLAVADAQCAARAPSDVVLRRLNSRAWGGIALAAALVVSVAALVGDTPGAVAADRRIVAGPTQGRRDAGDLRRIPIRTASSDAAQPPAAPAHTPESSSHSLEDSAKATAPEAADAKHPAPPTAQRNTGADSGTGPGSARSRSPAQPSSPVVPRAATSARPTPGVTPAGGAGTTAASPSTPTDPAAPGTSASSPAPPAPPWRSDTWPADARRARAALDSGQIPPAHRDLVRAYFDRP